MSSEAILLQSIQQTFDINICLIYFNLFKLCAHILHNSDILRFLKAEL